MKWLWPFNLIEKFARFLAKIPNVLLSATGGLILALSLVAGAVIERKDVAVAVAIAGTFVGTALLSFFIPKLLYTMQVKELRQAAEDASAKERLIEEERKNRDVERRLAGAKQEINRLESMRINLDSFSAALKLGLLEIDMHITDFDRKPIGRTERYKLDPRKDFDEVYVGVFTIPSHAQLGIDLATVRLKEDSEGRITVSNITPSHVIDTLKGVTWKMDEIRREFINDDKIVEVQSDPADARCKELSREHEEQVRGRLAAGQDFKAYEPAIIKRAEQVLRALLTPLGKEIVFSKESSLDGEQILMFLENHNKHLQVTIEERKRQVADCSKTG